MRILNLVCAGFGCLCGLSSVNLFALPGEAISLNAGLELYHDNNLFRSDKGAEQSDLITAFFVEAAVDKQISRQRLLLDARLSDNRYRDNDGLDYQGKSVAGEWRWAIASEFKGNISFDYDETINSFEDFSRSDKNIRTNQLVRIEGEWLLTQRWSIFSAVSRFDRDNSAEFLAESAYGSNSLELGGRYRTPKDSYLALSVTKSNGFYDDRNVSEVNQIDSGFDQYRTEIRWLWQLSGHSRVDGNLGFLQREHDNFDDRNYEGVVGKVRYRWQNRGGWQVDAETGRNLSSYQTTPAFDFSLFLTNLPFYNSSYYEANYIALQPKLYLSEKLILSGMYRLEQRHYKGGLQPNIPAADRKDDIQYLNLSLNWAPVDYFLVSTTLQRSARDSNRKRSNYTSDMLILAASVRF